jgi:hypothetical protein
MRSGSALHYPCRRICASTTGRSQTLLHGVRETIKFSHGSTRPTNRKEHNTKYEYTVYEYLQRMTRDSQRPFEMPSSVSHLKTEPTSETRIFLSITPNQLAHSIFFFDRNPTRGRAGSRSRATGSPLLRTGLLLHCFRDQVRRARDRPYHLLCAFQTPPQK